MAQVDILLPTYNRLLFTQAVVQALFENTEWELVRRMVVIDDGSKDGTAQFVDKIIWPVPSKVIHRNIGGPAAAMIAYMADDPTYIWAKIDNDTMVPSQWLSESVEVMEANPELAMLGLEAMAPAYGGRKARTYQPCSHIGGIGLFRTDTIKSLDCGNGRWGWGEWQIHHQDEPRGWLNPALPVFLLDRMPTEPWHSLSEMYIGAGWQRSWPKYDPATHGHLWSWYA